MKSKLVCVASQAMIASTCITFLGCNCEPKYQEAEQYIQESEKQWAESVASGDTSVIIRILADDFIGVDPDGNQYDKQTMIKETSNSPKFFLSNHLNGVRVRFYGNTAVAQGDETWVRRKDSSIGRFVWTDTWVRRKGNWQIVAAEDLIAPTDEE